MSRGGLHEVLSPSDGVGILVVNVQKMTKWLKPPFSPVPGAPPQMVNAYPESSTSLRIVWEPPPENKQNGVIAYYKIFYVPKTRSDSEATVIEIKNANAREFVIDELMKWAGYRVWMLAGTSVGDGPKSSPIEIQTDEDGTYLPSLTSIQSPYNSHRSTSNVVDRLLHSLSTPIDFFFSFKTPTLSDHSFFYLSSTSSSEPKLPEGGNTRETWYILTSPQRRGEHRNIVV